MNIKVAHLGLISDFLLVSFVRLTMDPFGFSYAQTSLFFIYILKKQQLETCLPEFEIKGL
jgi:hypothetical protein